MLGRIAGEGGRHRRVLIATGLFAIAQMVIVIGGFADNGALCDDAFYYFQIAKNAAAGHGFSFDGLHATNGFHPLLCWLSVPIFALTSSAWLPIRVVLCLLGLATAATGYVLYRIGRLLGSERSGELMALLFLLSPFTWIIPLRGCEAGLVALTIALVLAQAAAMREIHTTAALRLGALVGLAGLARTDNVFLAVGIGVWLLTRTRQLRPLLAFVGAAALVVSPWLIWSLAHFGTIVQVSGAAKTAYRLTHGLPFGLRHALSSVYDVAHVPMKFLVGEELQRGRFTDVMVGVNAAIFAACVVAGGRRRPPAVLLPLAVLAALHVLYYAFVQHAYFSWYPMPLIVGAALVQGERLTHASTRFVACIVAASVLAGVFTVGAFIHRYPPEPYAPERRVADAVAAIETLPPGAHAGTWNAGRIGYFGMLRRADVSVVNLDGVVNNELFAAWQRGEYTPWVVANVGWLVESPRDPLDGAVAVPVNHALWRIAMSAR